MQTIQKEEYADITFQPELKIIIIRWKGKQNSEQYRSTFSNALKFAEHTLVTNFISDIREQRLVSPDDRKWFQEVALPGAVNLGLKHAAVVMTGNIFKRYYINNIMNTTKRFGLPMKFFNSMDEAINWLKSF